MSQPLTKKSKKELCLRQETLICVSRHSHALMFYHNDLSSIPHKFYLDQQTGAFEMWDCP